MAAGFTLNRANLKDFKCYILEDNNSVAYWDLPNLPPAFNIGPIK
jgi:hypothetical protein